MTEIAVKLLGLPECVGSGICHFPDVDRACQAVMATIQMCLPIARIELLDATQNRHSCLEVSLPTLTVRILRGMRMRANT